MFGFLLHFAFAIVVGVVVAVACIVALRVAVSNKSSTLDSQQHPIDEPYASGPINA